MTNPHPDPTDFAHEIRIHADIGWLRYIPVCVTANLVSFRSKFFFFSAMHHLEWLGHVARMDEARIPKQALQWEVVGFKRRPGRPRTNWRDVVNKDLQRMELTWEDVEASAQDRQTWRQRVALCIGDAG